MQEPTGPRDRESVAVARGQERSPLAWITTFVAAASALGILVILVGLLFDMEGAREGEEGSVVFEVAWWAFFFGAIAALVLGLVAFFAGRRNADPATTRAGRIALIWFGIAVVIFLVASVLTS